MLKIIDGVPYYRVYTYEELDYEAKDFVHSYLDDVEAYYYNGHGEIVTERY